MLQQTDLSGAAPGAGGAALPAREAASHRRRPRGRAGAHRARRRSIRRAGRCSSSSRWKRRSRRCTRRCCARSCWSWRAWCCRSLASLVLARRMVRPIQALQAGAARIGAGALDQRIDGPHRRRAGGAGRVVQPHDRRSCASRTPPWSRRSTSARATWPRRSSQLPALGDVSQAVNSSLDSSTC